MDSELAELIRSLDEIHERLGLRLSRDEAFRALQQLAERSAKGQPLASIAEPDLRRTLEADLAEPRIYRAWQRLGSARAALDGREEAPVSAAPVAAAAPAAAVENKAAAAPAAPDGATVRNSLEAPEAAAPAIEVAPKPLAPSPRWEAVDVVAQAIAAVASAFGVSVAPPSPGNTPPDPTPAEAMPEAEPATRADEIVESSLEAAVAPLDHVNGAAAEPVALAFETAALASPEAPAVAPLVEPVAADDGAPPVGEEVQMGLAEARVLASLAKLRSGALEVAHPEDTTAKAQHLGESEPRPQPVIDLPPAIAMHEASAEGAVDSWEGMLIGVPEEPPIVPVPAMTLRPREPATSREGTMANVAAAVAATVAAAERISEGLRSRAPWPPVAAAMPATEAEPTGSAGEALPTDAAAIGLAATAAAGGSEPAEIRIVPRVDPEPAEAIEQRAQAVLWAMARAERSGTAATPGATSVPAAFEVDEAAVEIRPRGYAKADAAATPEPPPSEPGSGVLGRFVRALGNGKT